MDREAIIEQVIQILMKERKRLYQSYNTHRTATNEAPSAMTSRHDTSREELGAVADAMAQRVTALDELIGRIRIMPTTQGRIQLGAIALVQEDDIKSYVFIVPEGGGGRTRERDIPIVTVSPTSPIGRALLGKREGDEIELTLPSGTRVLEVLDVG